LLLSELIHTQQEAKLFGPAFYSPAIWSVIFQVLHFPGLAFSVAPVVSAGLTNAVITIAIRMRYGYDPTTTHRARLLPFDASEKNE